MARPKSPFKKRRCSVYLRDSVYVSVVELLEDPLKPGDIPYGELSKYVNQLIAKDLRDKHLMGEEALTKLLSSLETDGA